MLSRSLVAAALFTAVAWPAAAQELSLKRVMLSSGGIGYFEHEAEIDGNAELKLNVRFDQVDDVLKSLVVYDDKGGIGGVSLPGRDALAEAFRGLPFNQDALGSLATLVRALQGAEITVSGPRAVSGRVVAVTPETTTVNGRSEQRHRISLLTADGVVQQFLLEEAQDLQFNDPALRKQIADALAAVRENRARDSRTLTVSLRGNGKRVVRAAYVVSVPVWKAAYRVTLPADANATKAGMQGWAVLENMTGTDWSNVELTLVSGSPVTFRQALYQAYYVNRPEVPVEVVGRIMPRLDQGGITADNLTMEQERRRAGFAASPPAAAMAAPPPAPAPKRDERYLARPVTQAGAADAASSDESFTQVSFKFPQPISIGAGRTLSVPIVDREVPARRLALYQPETHARHPLAAIEIRNDGTTGLPPGILTIYERNAAAQAAYVGDARLAGLPVGDKRLLSYALDTKTIVERDAEQTRRIVKGTIANGIFRYTVAQTLTTTWRVKPPANEGRNMLLEQPGYTGWTVVKPEPRSVEISENRFRVAASIPAGTQTKVELVLEQPINETMMLSGASSDAIAAFARDTQLDKPTRDAFARIMTLQNDVVRHQQRLGQLDNERQTIVADQERLRGNLGSVPRDSDLYKRYLAKLEEQENAIERLAKDRTATEQALLAARQALSEYIAKL